ncbi:MAG TPA: HlyD family secretion protein [Acetobacteraceae bacterium]|nr:HlyD family secretion protein [Acetobacteraceae bacterium]
MDIGQPSAPAVTRGELPRGAARPRLNWRRLRLVLGLVALVAVLGFTGQWAWRMYTHVYADDARVAADTIILASRMPGWVAEMTPIAGDAVPRGTVLARIDGRETGIAIREIEARIAGIGARRAELEARIALVDRQTTSGREASRARLTASRAALPAAEADRTFAEAEYARARDLTVSGSGTRQRLDQTRALLEAARHRVAAAAAEIENAEAQLAAAEAAREELTVLRRQLESLAPQEAELRAGRERLALDLADRTLRMPFDGVVDRVFVDPGEYVTAGQRMLMVHDETRVRVEANVKETDIRHFAPGTRVRITVDAWPGRVFEGRVERIAPAATSEFALLPSPNPSGNFTRITQRLPVRIVLDPPPEPGVLRPGMLVIVEARTRE